MVPVLMLVIMYWSTGLQAKVPDQPPEPEDVRLVGGGSRCAGRVEMNHKGEWRNLARFHYRDGTSDNVWTMGAAAVMCRQLDCGSAASTRSAPHGEDRPTWLFRSKCAGSESALRECGTVYGETNTSYIQEVICSESVRLVNGAGLCSGRVEVRSGQSWASVCEANFDWQDAEVVCRELGCGAPSALRRALYGEGKGPTWAKEFQCEGNESRLLDCDTSGSDRNTSSPANAVGLTCSEPDDVRLVGGGSRCAGRVEMNHQGEWRILDTNSASVWAMGTAAVMCRQLGCGSAVSERRVRGSEQHPAWEFISRCAGSESALRQCGSVLASKTSHVREVVCSESVRLVNGAGLCSGRVEVRSDLSWASVCEADFDWQDAEVICRELGCGAPSALRGALYGEGKSPLWNKEFQCEGNESRLLDCDTSDSDRNTCSPANAVGLTCSEPDDVRLVGGGSRCAGRVEVNHQGKWRSLCGFIYRDGSEDFWTLSTAAVVCRQLGCGSAVSTRSDLGAEYIPTFLFKSNCAGSESALRDCGSVLFSDSSSRYVREVICSESVRLVNGAGLCSGRVEVRSDQSWASVCEADFDWQNAEVVCRDLGCGAPSALQGALYGEGKGPIWAKEFQCKGNESRLLDCDTSGSDRNTCSPANAVGLTCSEPDDVRLVGEGSRCAGRVEVKLWGEWIRLRRWSVWTLDAASVACRQLGCGSAVSTRAATVEKRGGRFLPVWQFTSRCAGSESALRECGEPGIRPEKSSQYLSAWEVVCSDLLFQPNISLSSSMGGVSQGQQQGLQVFKDHSFNITCSIQPQYPGGSFHLTFTGSNTTLRHTLTAVNHSVYFLFPAADHAHQGNYSCVYEVYVFSHNFTSESELLSVTVADHQGAEASREAGPGEEGADKGME